MGGIGCAVELERRPQFGHGEAFGDFHVAAAQAGAQIGAAHYFWLPPKRLTAGNLLTDNRGLHCRRGS
jgi:hypothetical protein